MVMSFDVCGHTHNPIELYGTEGSLQVPDPNTFGGKPMLKKQGQQDWKEIPMSHGYTENTRGIGAADMARAVITGRRHRCSGALAYHVLDVMRAFEESSDSGANVTLSSSCEKPAPLPLGLANGQLD
jgi:predicted dehydrogenase